MIFFYKNRLICINICTYLTFLSKGYRDAIDSDEKISFFAKNFPNH